MCVRIYTLEIITFKFSLSQMGWKTRKMRVRSRKNVLHMFCFFLGW